MVLLNELINVMFPLIKKTLPVFSDCYAFICGSDALLEIPRSRQRHEKIKSVGKYVCGSMLLNNNQLADVFGFLDILDSFLVQPRKLMWLDLSFNMLTTIDPVRLHHFAPRLCCMTDINLPL